MDWTLALTCMLIIIWSLSGLWRPEKNVASVEGWRKRLNELKAGASESYFEERRQLEAYPPPEHATITKLRAVSLVGLSIGAILIVISAFR